MTMVNHCRGTVMHWCCVYEIGEIRHMCYLSVEYLKDLGGTAGYRAYLYLYLCLLLPASTSAPASALQPGGEVCVINKPGTTGVFGDPHCYQHVHTYTLKQMYAHTHTHTLTHTHPERSSCQRFSGREPDQAVRAKNRISLFPPIQFSLSLSFFLSLSLSPLPSLPVSSILHPPFTASSSIYLSV